MLCLVLSNSAMRRIVLSVIIILLLCFPAWAQTYLSAEKYLVDSLVWEELSPGDRLLLDSSISQFNDCLDDSCRVAAISNIVEESWDDNVWPRYNDWLYQFILRSLPPKEEKNTSLFLKKNLAGALNNKGYLCNSQGDITCAMDYYEKCLEIQKEINDYAGLANTYINVGYIYLNQGLLDAALENYYQSLRIQESLDNQAGVATALNGIGYMLYKQGHADSALAHYNRSLDIRTVLDDSYGIATCYNNIGLVYMDRKQWDEALGFYSKGLNLERTMADEAGMAISMGNIANIYKQKGDAGMALQYYDSAHRVHTSQKNIAGTVQTLDAKANIRLGQGRNKRAFALATEAMTLASQVRYPSLLRDVSQTLMKIERARGNFQKALSYYDLYIEMRDSVFNEETVTESIHRQYEYNYRRKALADSIHNANLQATTALQLAASRAVQQRLATEAENKRIQLLAVVVVLLMVSLFSVLLHRRLKTIKQQKETIEQQNEELQSQQENIQQQNKDLSQLNYELRQFAHTVSHDLKAPIASVVNMLYMIEDMYPDAEEELKRHLEMIKDSSLTSIELVNGILAYSEAGEKETEVKKVDLHTVLRSVIDQCPGSSDFAIHVNGPMPAINGNEHQIRQVFSNLINNAIKYNDKPKGEGEIAISYLPEGELYRFRVADNGPGIPVEKAEAIFEIFQVAHTHGPSVSTGIGLAIVKKLVLRNGGEISVESTPGKGATFTFTWPKPAYNL